ncbi:MAG: glutamate 5-kinase [Prochloraceae cyanobacterium]
MPLTLVVKIGTSSLKNASSGQLRLATIAALVETLSDLHRAGHRIVLVSSGAVGVGCTRLKLKERPRTIALKQAIAAVGQGRLIGIYDGLFGNLEVPIAQVLLTRRDLIQRSSYLNAHNTFKELLQLGVIAIVNENDTVAVEELKFGDNDTLAARVASMLKADWLFLLTDVDRLYSADPRVVPEAKPIDLVNDRDFELLEVEAGSTTKWGTGGMVTKLDAARIATSAGVRTVITRGQQPENIKKILQGQQIGTQFEPRSTKIDSARKRWIVHGLEPMGKLYLDEGAIGAICQGGKSLLAAGIAGVEGNFDTFDAVLLCDRGTTEIARGIVNYNSKEIEKIMGARSQKIPDLLGYAGADTVVHRDNLVLLRSHRKNKNLSAQQP